MGVVCCTNQELRAAPTRVAFVGNSFLYFNDVPRLFHALGGGGGSIIVGDCLRGGASWADILKDGNGMEEVFSTPNAKKEDGTFDIGAPTVDNLLVWQPLPHGWDFVVMATCSQEAALPETRPNGLEALDFFAPLLTKARALPVLMPTPAYRAQVGGSESLGSWEEFTRTQAEGFETYMEKLAPLCSEERQPRLADMNGAFEIVHNERDALWRDLFDEDDIHPSALGSYLAANLIYGAVFGQLPDVAQGIPSDAKTLWARARHMSEGRLPTRVEMAYLRGVAARVVGVALARARHREPGGGCGRMPRNADLD